MKIRFTYFAMMLVVLATCKKNDDGNNQNGKGIANFTNSKCKTHFIITNLGSKDDCIKYSWSNNVLHIKHINAGFNCCPNPLSAEALVSDSTIIVNEKENPSNPCDCMCLFDLDYDIPNVNKGLYQFKVNEPTISQDSLLLEFNINLNVSDSGTYCIPRYRYPWNI